MNKFYAKECNFDGNPGFMVGQYIKGVKVCEQFVSKDAYDVFCEVLGFRPECSEDLPDPTQAERR